MVTNVTINPIDGDTVVYLQDGSSTIVESGTTKSFQIIEKGFATISDAGHDDASEHPDQPPGQPPSGPPKWFVEAMQKFAELMRKAIQKPEATPV